MSAASTTPGMTDDLDRSRDLDHDDYTLPRILPAVVQNGDLAGPKTIPQTHPFGGESPRIPQSASLEDVRAAMTTMPMIEQAKGVLMLSHGLSADAVFALLCWHSQRRNVKVRDIAAVLIENLGRIVNGSNVRQHLDQILDGTAGA